MAAVALPLVWRNDYVIDVALTALIWMVLNQSWNLQLGIGGIWNFGQLAIFAIGGYVAGLVSLHWGIPPWLSLIMGGVAAALVSAVIGIPVLRLRGIYASLLTFSFGEVVRLLVISDESGLTGGSFGLSGIPGLAFEGLSPDAKQRAYYWLALGLVVLTAIFIYVFIHSPLGTALKALRDSPAYAASRGVSPLKMQVITFGTSAFIAGVAGAFYAQYFGTISPSVMGLGPLSLFVAMLVVGGLGTFWGPMLGTAVIVVVSEVPARLRGSAADHRRPDPARHDRPRASRARAVVAGGVGPAAAMDGRGRGDGEGDDRGGCDRRRSRPSSSVPEGEGR